MARKTLRTRMFVALDNGLKNECECIKTSVIARDPAAGCVIQGRTNERQKYEWSTKKDNTFKSGNFRLYKYYFNFLPPTLFLPDILSISVFQDQSASGPGTETWAPVLDRLRRLTWKQMRVSTWWRNYDPIP